MALWRRWQLLRRALQPLASHGHAWLHNEAEAAAQQAAAVARELGAPQASAEVFDRCVQADHCNMLVPVT